VAISFNALQIITKALQEAHVHGAGVTLPDNVSSEALDILNMMMKSWQLEGIPVWKIESAVSFVAVGQTKYSLGSTSTDRATLSHVKTELAVAAILGAVTITVDSATGISNGDVIGIVQNDNTIHWTTVNGVPAGAVITLTVGLTVAAAIDREVFAYTTLLTRPLRVKSMTLDEDGTESEIRLIPGDEYRLVPNKTYSAAPFEAWYDPQLTLGELHLWPSPDTVSDRIRFAAAIEWTEFASLTSSADFPQEAYWALIWNLAAELAPKHKINLERQALLTAMAEKKKAVLQTALDTGGWNP